ncbi:MAG: DUF2092 domain-containing protein [Planctomycetaceae bacterium]|nr:DUF2092 domain-containing protein [Planctomycetaceae bacterium]
MMELQKDFHPNLLETAVGAVLCEPAPDDLSPEQITQLLAVVRQAVDRPCPVTLMQRVKNMRPLAKIAVAASALIVLAGLLSWLVPGGGIAVAFADVAETLNAIQSATWKGTHVVEMTGPEKKTITEKQVGMFLAPSHERIEMSGNVAGPQNINIIDGQKNKILSFYLPTKTASVIDIAKIPAWQKERKPPIGQEFLAIRELAANARSGKAGKVERLGRKTLDGQPTEGFRIPFGVATVEIWANAKTLLPVRVVEVDEAPGGGHKVRIEMTDFKVNVPLDKSLFSLDVPPGYTVQQVAHPDTSKSPWSCLADALKMVAEHNGGVFPPTLRGERGIDGLMQQAVKTFMENRGKGSPVETTKLGMDMSMKMGDTYDALNYRPPQAFHYFGKDVKLGTPNRPILWIEPNKTGDRCVVIYADLSIKEISAKEMPKMPPSEEKGERKTP